MGIQTDMDLAEQFHQSLLEKVTPASVEAWCDKNACAPSYVHLCEQIRQVINDTASECGVHHYVNSVPGETVPPFEPTVRCPICSTWGHEHRKGCANHAVGMARHVPISPFTPVRQPTILAP